MLAAMPCAHFWHVIMQPVTSHEPIDGSSLYQARLGKRPAFLQPELLLAVSEWLRPFPAQKQAQPLLPTPLRTQLNRGCPKSELTHQSNQFEGVFAFSFSLPFLKPSSFRVGHRSGGYWITIFIWELYDNTKQVPTRISLAQDIINRIFSFGFRPLDKRFAKAYFFNFFRGDTVSSNVLNPVFWPDDPPNLHSLIVAISYTATT